MPDDGKCAWYQTAVTKTELVGGFGTLGKIFSWWTGVGTEEVVTCKTNNGIYGLIALIFGSFILYVWYKRR